MIKEGGNVKVYLHSEALGKSYDGIIDKVKLPQLKREIAEADVIVFDLNRVNEKTKNDLALLNAFGLPHNSPSVFGAIADKLKKEGKQVVGSSAWTDQLEFDRNFGSVIAERIGLSLPTTKRFRAVGEAQKFLNGNTDLWVLKPNNNADLDLTYVEKYPGEIFAKLMGDLKGRINGPFILQEKVKGVECSTEGFWDGEKWSGFNHTIESKRLMNSDLGPAIGSQSNTVWMESEPRIKKAFDKLSPMLQRVGYVGPIDVNAIYKDGKPYFLEWSPRYGYDAIYNTVELLDSSLYDFMSGNFSAARFKPGFSCSERVSIPPYPYDDKSLVDKYAKDIPVKCDMGNFYTLDVYRNGSLKCAGGDGIIGICARQGNSIGGAFGNVYRYIKDNVQIGSYLQYRTDAARNHQKRFDKYYDQEA